MKKVIVLGVVLAIIVGIAFNAVFTMRANAQTESDAGAYLKSIGIVHGYNNGALLENKYITQAEYISLLARLLKKTKKVKRENLVRQENYFDYLINKAYHAYLILYGKFLTFYYEGFSKLAYLARHKYVSGSLSDAWYFSDLMYLKRNGFTVPEDFNPNGVISTGNAIKWLLDTFGLGNGKEFVVRSPGISDDDVVQVLSVEHSFNFGNNNANLAKPVKRGEAFALVADFLRTNSIQIRSPETR